MHRTADLPAESDAGLLAKSEGADVPVERFLAQGNRDFCRADIRRPADDFGNGEQPELMFVSKGFSREKEFAVLAVNPILQRKPALVQGRRDDHNFES